MRSRIAPIFPTCVTLLLLAACTAEEPVLRDLVIDIFPEEQGEIRAAVLSIESDIESANVDGLQAMHLVTDKFTKFGPRSFDRQDVDSANQSEAAFFSAISDAKYEARDLKIDVFGEIGIATYYPQVSFVRNGENVRVSGRQTLVFLKTDAGWKIVHEHGTIRPQ